MTIFKPCVHDTVYSVNKQHLHRFLWGVCRSWAGCCCGAPGTWRWLTCSLGTGFLSVTGQIQSHPSAHLDRCQLPPTSHHRWHWRWTWNRMTTVLSFLCKVWGFSKSLMSWHFQKQSKLLPLIWSKVLQKLRSYDLIEVLWFIFDLKPYQLVVNPNRTNVSLLIGVKAWLSLSKHYLNISNLKSLIFINDQNT